MATHHGHPDGGGADLHGGIVEDLLGLMVELHLLLGEVVFEEDVTMGQAVPVDGVGVDAGGVRTLALLLELVDSRLSGSGYALVRAHDGPADEEAVVKRFERHDQLDRRAIGVGDDEGVTDGIRVDFRYHQGHAGVHAPGRAVVDDRGAHGLEGGCPLLAHIASGAEQGDVGLALHGFLHAHHGDVLALEFHRGAKRTTARHRKQFLDGKFPGGEALEHGSADQSGGADDGNGSSVG